MLIQRLIKDARVLLVDDQSINLEILEFHVSQLCDVQLALSGEEALEVCNGSHPPDLILLDVMMPGIGGLETCKRIKSDELLADIPIIFVTSQSLSEEQMKCWEAGASDFVTKPIDPMTLMHRVKTHVELKLQTDFLKSQVYRDGLTGIFNRGYLDKHGETLFNHASRQKSELSLLMIDIDYFKRYNDEYGHLQGDTCLKAVANALDDSASRPLDIVCRYGGEEFCCILPETNLEGARIIADKMCKEIYNLGITHSESPHQSVSVSIGVATKSDATSNFPELISTADAKLYKAKQNGRNNWL